MVRNHGVKDSAPYTERHKFLVSSSYKQGYLLVSFFHLILQPMALVKPTVGFSPLSN